MLQHLCRAINGRRTVFSRLRARCAIAKDVAISEKFISLFMYFEEEKDFLLLCDAVFFCSLFQRVGHRQDERHLPHHYTAQCITVMENVIQGCCMHNEGPLNPELSFETVLMTGVGAL